MRIFPGPALSSTLLDALLFLQLCPSMIVPFSLANTHFGTPAQPFAAVSIFQLCYGSVVPGCSALFAPRGKKVSGGEFTA